MITDLFHDFNIDTAPEGHKHYRTGWVNVECPYCVGEHRGYHIGFNIEKNYFYCFRCGWHSVSDAVSKILGVNKSEAKKLAKDYKINKPGKEERNRKKVKIDNRKVKFPSTIPLQKRHRKYLVKRNYDPDWLEQEWELIGTGPVCFLEYKDKNREKRKIDLKHRILIPIYWDNRIVSFQTRDITDKAEKKYIVCPQSNEIIDHKKIIYCKQNKLDPEIGICVEGVTDVWRFGTISFGTFGVEYTQDQVRLISRLFKRVAVVFDPDNQAQKKADELVDELRFRGIIAWKEKIDCDPGSLSQEEANKLVTKIINHERT